MNKTELIAALAENLETTKVNAAQIVDAFTLTVAGALKNGEDVTLRGFGTFKPKTRAARTGRNPQTGEAIQIAEKKTVGFKSQIEL